MEKEQYLSLLLAKKTFSLTEAFLGKTEKLYPFNKNLKLGLLLLVMLWEFEDQRKMSSYLDIAIVFQKYSFCLDS